MCPTKWRDLDTRHWRVPAKENIRDKHDIHNFFFVNDTQREKLCFIQISTRMDGWLLLTFFYMFTQPIKFYYIFTYQVRLQMFEKCDSSNRHQKWMVAHSSTFYDKIWLGFCLNTGKLFFLEASFWANIKSIGSSKKRY